MLILIKILACFNNMTEVALRLLDMDSQPQQVNNRGHSTLTYAVENNMTEIIERLTN